MKQPWQDDWAVGTLHGEGRGVTSRWSSLQLRCAGCKEQVSMVSLQAGRPAVLHTVSGCPKITPLRHSQCAAEGHVPFTTEGEPLSGHSFAFQTLPLLGPWPGLISPHLSLNSICCVLRHLLPLTLPAPQGLANPPSPPGPGLHPSASRKPIGSPRF